MNAHSTSAWKYPPRKRMDPTPLPYLFFWAVIGLVIIGLGLSGFDRSHVHDLQAVCTTPAC